MRERARERERGRHIESERKQARQGDMKKTEGESEGEREVVRCD